MYRDEVPLIAAEMRDSLRCFNRGIMFAIMSARTPIEIVPSILDEIDRDAEHCQWFNAAKYQGWLYVTQHGAQLRDDLGACDDLASMIRRLIHVPGLGIVKAAFALQFMGQDIACLDSHNMRWHGIGERAFKHPYSRPMIARYLAIAAGVGKAREFWDVWCTRVAAMRPDILPDADYVSRLHLAIVE